MILLNLNQKSISEFSKFKSTKELAQHGPLSFGKIVPTHIHSARALYFVKFGSARFVGKERGPILSCQNEFNAVIVEKEELHGWESMEQNTTIEHVFGEELINKVLM